MELRFWYFNRTLCVVISSHWWIVFCWRVCIGCFLVLVSLSWARLWIGHSITTKKRIHRKRKIVAAIVDVLVFTFTRSSRVETKTKKTSKTVCCWSSLPFTSALLVHSLRARTHTHKHLYQQTSHPHRLCVATRSSAHRHRAFCVRLSATDIPIHTEHVRCARTWIAFVLGCLKRSFLKERKYHSTEFVASVRCKIHTYISELSTWIITWVTEIVYSSSVPVKFYLRSCEIPRKQNNKNRKKKRKSASNVSSNSKLNFFALNTRTCCVRSDLSLRTLLVLIGFGWPVIFEILCRRQFNGNIGQHPKHTHKISSKN